MEAPTIVFEAIDYALGGLTGRRRKTGPAWRQLAQADGSYFGRRATFLPEPEALSRQVCRRAALKASKQMAARDGDRRNWRAVWAEHVVPMLGAK